MNQVMDTPILYSFRRCPYAIRARMALHKSGQVCELREVVLKDKPPHMLEISPKGTVPVLLLPDHSILEESLEILLWALAQNDPEQWLLSDTQRHEEAMKLIERNDQEFKFHLDRTKYPTRYEGVDGEEHRQAAQAFLKTLDELLQDHPFLFGERLSFADVAIVPFVRQFANVDRGRFDGLPFSKLHAWLDRLLTSPVFTDVMKKYPQWKEGEPGVAFPGQ